MSQHGKFQNLLAKCLYESGIGGGAFLCQHFVVSECVLPGRSVVMAVA